MEDIPVVGGIHLGEDRRLVEGDIPVVEGILAEGDIPVRGRTLVQEGSLVEGDIPVGGDILALGDTPVEGDILALGGTPVEGDILERGRTLAGILGVGIRPVGMHWQLAQERTPVQEGSPEGDIQDSQTW